MVETQRNYALPIPSIQRCTYPERNPLNDNIPSLISLPPSDNPLYIYREPRIRKKWGGTVMGGSSCFLRLLFPYLLPCVLSSSFLFCLFLRLLLHTHTPIQTYACMPCILGVQFFALGMKRVAFFVNGGGGNFFLICMGGVNDMMLYLSLTTTLICSLLL